MDISGKTYQELWNPSCPGTDPPGTDGFLRMTEVMGLNMNADIVALTACQTGLGKRTAGEGRWVWEGLSNMQAQRVS